MGIRILFLLWTLLINILCIAQTLPREPIYANRLPQINYELNRITFGTVIPLYKKLQQLKVQNNGVINIVHIGDSHIQPDFISSVIRDNMQAFFGNAGRGLIFPYQLARTNAPDDIVASSNTGWEYCRLSYQKTPAACGIAGYAIKSNYSLAQINFKLKNKSGVPQLFNRAKIFVEGSDSWMYEIDSMIPVSLNDTRSGSLPYSIISMEDAQNAFSLLSNSNGQYQSFYGVSLENDLPGVRLHTIGVNGARYDHYNLQPLFWKQLAALWADLVIVSLGTNEAQNQMFDVKAFLNEVRIFTDNVKKIFPDAVILITTPPDSYKGSRSNPVVKRLAFALSGFCADQNIALWDLYKVTNGYGSARSWLIHGLLKKDHIHYTPEAYIIQGKLLFNALAQGYNDYLKTLDK